MTSPAELFERSQWDFFWVPSGTEVLDRPDVAALRSPRRLPHLNQVTRVRTRDPARLVREVHAWIGHDVARWFVPDTFDRAPLTEALVAGGWAPVGRYEARVLRAADYARTKAAGLTVRRVETRASLLDCQDVMRRAFDRPLDYSPDEIDEELAQCADPSGRVHRFVVYRDGTPIASGGINTYPALRLAMLWAGGTVPEARNAGAYITLLAHRVELARALGLEWVGIYAKEATSAPIVARQGFEYAGEMHYWSPGGVTV